MMKTTLLSLTAAFALVGCQERDQSVSESAGAQKDSIEESAEAQKDSLEQQKDALEREARMQKEQLSEKAEAKKESIEADVDAQKAQIEAQEKQIEAQAKADKAQVEASEEIQEAAGAAQQDVNSDSSLETRIRSSLFGSDTAQPTATSTAQNVKITVKDGVATLKGTVASDAEKADYESKVKAVSGVKSVDNQLEVKAP